MKTKITILDKRANYKDSMRILGKEGMRAMTYQEALSRGEELIEAFEAGPKWFYLAGVGLTMDGDHTFNSKGELMDLKGNEPKGKKVRVCSGTNPLYLVVYSDDVAAWYGGRFDLGALCGPYVVASVVVGVPKSGNADGHRHRFVCECGKVRK